MMRIASLAGLVAGVFLACSPPSTARSGRDPNLLTREEILASYATNAYDAVARLRPNFLVFHGQNTINGTDTGYPKVYLDHILFGDLTSLRSLDPNAIREIRYYNAAAASSRFGLGNASGAIEVISETGR
jgi:hypothetical protein